MISFSRMLRVVVSLCVFFPAIASATPLLRFSVIGDTPYSDGQAEALKWHILRQNLFNPESDLFIHVGDIKPDEGFCAESDYTSFVSIMSNLNVPLLVVPGDNEWTDCGIRAVSGTWDSAYQADIDEAWDWWIEYIKDIDTNATALTLDRQASPGNLREENFATVLNNVLIIGINLIGGGKPNSTTDSPGATEWETRLADDIEWIQTQFTTYQNDSDVDAVVLISQTDQLNGPEHFDYTEGETTKNFTDELKAASDTFDRPILILYGDGHTYTLKSTQWDDSPIDRDMFSLEVGGEWHHPAEVVVTFDTGDYTAETDDYFPFLINKRRWHDWMFPLTQIGPQSQVQEWVAGGML